MINLKGIGLAALLLALFSQAGAQLWTGAANLSGGTVTIDGRLDEAIWAGPAKAKIDQSNVGYGVVDNDADCYVQFATLWDATGWYLGVWFYDDIHAALNSQYLDAANIAYDDDGLQLLVNYSFDDAYNSQEGTSYHGLYGQSLVKGFGNLDPALQYAGFWGATSSGAPLSYNWTIADQQAKGWENAFTSDDGLIYQYEAKFAWSGELMVSCGARNQGDAVGLNLVVNDNDGGFGVEGQMTLLPLSAGAQQWGKVVLAGPAKIAQTRIMAPISNSTYKNFSFDPLGRRIATIGRAPTPKNMLIVRNQQGKAIRSISR